MGKNNLSGAWGEALAAEYLRKKRYEILSSGYRCRFGEIDLIARDRKYLVFAEVKLRKSQNFARAMEYVDQRKQERIRTTASLYLAEHPTELQPRLVIRKPIRDRLSSSSGSWPKPAVPSSVRIADIMPFFRFSYSFSKPIPHRRNLFQQDLPPL